MKSTYWGIIRICSLIIFNVGIGTLFTIKAHWITYSISIFLAVIGNILIIALTRDLEKMKNEN